MFWFAPALLSCHLIKCKTFPFYRGWEFLFMRMIWWTASPRIHPACSQHKICKIEKWQSSSSRPTNCRGFQTHQKIYTQIHLWMRMAPFFWRWLERASMLRTQTNKPIGKRINGIFMNDFFFHFILILIRFIRFIWRQAARHSNRWKSCCVWFDESRFAASHFFLVSWPPTLLSRCLFRFVISLWWLVKRKHIMHVFAHIWSAYLCSCVKMLKIFENHLNLECWSGFFHTFEESLNGS